MNIFEAVTDSVTAKMAAESCGLKINRSGMTICPFHNDRKPSLKVDERFHCFACGADGDAINFIEKYYGMAPYDAAKYLADRFGVIYDDDSSELKRKKETGPGPQPVRKDQPSGSERRFLDAVWKCFVVYSDYLELLRKWRIEYAPTDENEEWDPRFTEALREETHVEYLLDVLMNGNAEDIADLIIDVGKEVNDLERRIAEFNFGEEGGADEHDRYDDGGDRRRK